MTGRGDLNNDEMAVVDVKLGLSGLKGVEIIDAGVFLEMRITNRILTVLTMGEAHRHDCGGGGLPIGGKDKNVE